ncbi:MAG: MXAN_6521/LA_1396 family lipoprotein [Myxococcaceae bacterium]|nr:MXAN_6521/LA_1396 family lipoprotein [Myxococcaceae bacterium]MCI0672403.1 MXAN_6521/LA_1396 family lipoprotein [Myxococcaceae bacterium]
MPLKRPSLMALVVVLASGCTAVKMSRVRPDYEQVDRQTTKRLVVVTAPLPAGNERLGQLWSLIARRYVNQNRDFIAKENRVDASADFQPTSACSEGLEGVLVLKPQNVELRGNGVEAGVTAQLFRCKDGAEVWAAEAGGSWDAADPLYEEQRALYVSEMGEEVSPYVAPSFQLLKAALDTLPNPVLSDEDVTEKIELGE